MADEDVEKKEENKRRERQRDRRTERQRARETERQTAKDTQTSNRDCFSSAFSYGSLCVSLFFRNYSYLSEEFNINITMKQTDRYTDIPYTDIPIYRYTIYRQSYHLRKKTLGTTYFIFFYDLLYRYCCSLGVPRVPYLLEAATLYQELTKGFYQVLTRFYQGSILLCLNLLFLTVLTLLCFDRDPWGP